MKASGAAIATNILAIVLSPAGQAADMGGHGFHKGGLQAKIEYCTKCHGASGARDHRRWSRFSSKAVTRFHRRRPPIFMKVATSNSSQHGARGG